jgi:hypothetical protein
MWTAECISPEVGTATANSLKMVLMEGKIRL